MNLKDEDELLDTIREMFRKGIKVEHGEYTVSVTVNHGRPVRIQDCNRRDVAFYSNKKVVVEK